MRAIILILVAAGAISAQASKEAALGAQLAGEIRRRTTAIENPAVQDYVERMGNKLAAQSPKANVIYKFALISDEAGGATHEPLSLPGGYIFVSADLFRSAADEAEFAAMLAHAMAHVPLALPRPDNIPLIFMGGWNGLGAGSNGSLVPISLLKTQRENETRADALAIQAMSASGYDPVALTVYIARTQPPSERSGQIFAVLPDRDARIAAIQQAIADLPPRTYQPTDQNEFGRMQEEVRSSVPPAKEPARPTLKRQN
jgi:predicted Zn-dependent protease